MLYDADRMPGDRVLHFVRHGQYEPTPAGGVLTPLGRRQAARAGKRLSDLAGARLYASDLSRAQESAALIAEQMGAVKVVTKRDLRECTPTGIRGMKVSLAKRAAGRDQVDRLCEALLKPANRPRRDIYVCHGNLIRAIVCRVLGARPTAWMSFGTHHCGITTVTVRASGRLVVTAYNDVGHLPSSMQTQQ